MLRRVGVRGQVEMTSATHTGILVFKVLIVLC